MQSKIRALGLISGGLDSTLAARLLIDQGVDVCGVNFKTGFCITTARRQYRRKAQESPRVRHEALRAGDDLNFSVEIVDVSSEYLKIVTDPRWGYGKNANPCVDCRVMMLRNAREMLPELGAQFVFTGEVLGQRPMTQHRSTLRQIEKQCGLDGLLLRPLSARRLPETQVERQGWVDRNRLMDFAGRSRKSQLALAEQLGVTDFPQPAGGCCYLTDPSYSRRFFDFLRHLPPGREVSHDDFNLMKVGRHLRVSDQLKVIVGRDEAENDFLEYYTANRWTLRPVDVVGPLVLVDGNVGDDDLILAARILARYSDGRDQQRVTVECSHDGDRRVVEVEPLKQQETSQYIL